jgi:hypothetical protein
MGSVYLCDKLLSKTMTCEQVVEQMCIVLAFTFVIHFPPPNCCHLVVTIINNPTCYLLPPMEP